MKVVVHFRSYYITTLTCYWCMIPAAVGFLDVKHRWMSTLAGFLCQLECGWLEYLQYVSL